MHLRHRPLLDYLLFLLPALLLWSIKQLLIFQFYADVDIFLFYPENRL